MKHSKIFLEDCAGLLLKLRSEMPLVHCMTNTVVTGYTANCMLAVGAAPAMIDDCAEAAQFAGITGGLLINVGTITEMQTTAMRAAVEAANAAKTPWVLDPVAVGALTLRTALAKELKAKHPAIIRGNASEIMALAGFKSTSRGVDSTASVEEARDAAELLCVQTGATVLATGKVDFIASCGQSSLSVANGHPIMTRVTGVGCAQGALATAFAAVTDDYRMAALATALVMAVAGEMAATHTLAPGSYQIALLDALDAVSPEDLMARGKVSV